MLLRHFLVALFTTTASGCLFTTARTCPIPGIFRLTRHEQIHQIQAPCCQSESRATCDYLSDLFQPALIREKTRVASGSMGTVHKVRHPISGETLALKTFQPEADEKPSYFASAIQREFSIATRLNALPGFSHTHGLITTMQEDIHGNPSTQIHLVMEYVPLSLKELTYHDEHDWRWTDADIRCVFSQALRTVRTLHTNASLAHRDIKPGNLLLTLDGQIRLIDFGEAVSTDAGYARTFTGTPPFLAPELYTTWRNGYDAAAADLWAMGLLLLRMYLDDDPWSASDNVVDSDFRVFLEDPEAYLLAFKLPVDIHRAVKTLLSMDPQRRYHIDQVWDEIGVVGQSCVEDHHGQLRLIIGYE